MIDYINYIKRHGGAFILRIYDCRRDYIKRSEKGGRLKNEDYVNCVESGNNLIAVLADGLGGQGDGEIASRMAGDSLLTCGADGAFPDRQIIMDAFHKANHILLKNQKNKVHMKTTAVYLCQRGNRAVWAHIGDSRLYHIFQDKILVLWVKSHGNRFRGTRGAAV